MKTIAFRIAVCKFDKVWYCFVLHTCNDKKQKCLIVTKNSAYLVKYYGFVLYCAEFVLDCCKCQSNSLSLFCMLCFILDCSLDSECATLLISRAWNMTYCVWLLKDESCIQGIHVYIYLLLTFTCFLRSYIHIS